MRVAARVVAVLGAVFWGLLFFGLTDLLTVFVEGEEFAQHYLLESGWGLLFLLLVAVPLVGLAVRPGTVVWVWTVLATGVALVLGALLSGSPKHLLAAGGVLATGAVVGWLGQTRSNPLGAMDHAAAVLTGISVFPSVAYALDMADNGPGETTNDLGHYPVQAALGLAVTFACAVLALSDGHPGRLLVRVVAAVPPAWIGVESVVWPDRTGSVGTTWGALAVAWGVLLLVAGMVPRVVSRANPTNVGLRRPSS